MDIGVVGLGVMGANLILNLEENGFTVSIYDRTALKLEEFYNQHSSKNIKIFSELESFANSLSEPRKIVILIKAGEPIDILLDSIVNFISPEDIVCDCGNSFYKDTDRRGEKFTGRMRYLGIGVSGGEYGARNGPSLMVGGPENAWNDVKLIMSKIAAKNENESVCCGYMGAGGAGHFIKMVHNGIEYCEMELIAETFLLLKQKYSNLEIKKIFEQWHQDGFLKGYLLEICIKILSDETDVIDKIVDMSSHKGTGVSCVTTGLEFGSPLTMMAEACFARTVSSRKDKRTKVAKSIDTIHKIDSLNLETLKGAFIMAKLVSYIQGFDLTMCYSDINGCKIDFSLVCQTWKNGCILRGDFLNVMSKAINECDGELLTTKSFKLIFAQNYTNLKSLIKIATDAELPIPCFSAALNFLNGMKIEKGSGNLIQAMRDYFGSHMVRIEGKDSDEHISWPL